MNPDTSRASVILTSFPRGPKSETRVSLDTFKGRSFVNARTWFLAPDATWRPTRQGVTFEVADLAVLARAVADAIERAKGGA